ncbi:MAG: hypothetical protein HYV09_00420 [Deltaproteobacteria bacterium]|nr:hypothetical protein [Deltaproteobacteria bacterium]
MRFLAAVVAAVVGACASEPPPKPAMPPVVRIPWPMRRHAAPAPAPEPTPSVDTEPSSLVVPGEPTPSVAPSAAPSAAPWAAPSVSVVPTTTSTSPAPPASPTSLLLPLSGPLRAPKLRNPMPGGVFAGYVGDTGLDVVGSPRTVYAIAAATVDYAEKGHTRWTGPKDSPYCVRLTLDEPITWKGRRVTHAYYAHLSSVAFEQAESAKSKRHVEPGQALGTSGVARGVPHLHLGLLLDGEVEQDDWAFILREGEVRAVLGGYVNGETLPKS